MITRRGGEGGTAPASKGAACRQIGLMAIHFSHFQDPFPDVDLLLDYKIFKLLDPKVIASQGCVTLWASSWGPGEQRLNTSLTPSGKDKEEQKKSASGLDTGHIIIRRSMQRPPVFSVQLLDFYLKASNNLQFVATHIHQKFQLGIPVFGCFASWASLPVVHVQCNFSLLL